MTLDHVVSILVFQSLHKDYGTAFWWCGFMFTLNTLFIQIYDHVKVLNNVLFAP